MRERLILGWHPRRPRTRRMAHNRRAAQRAMAPPPPPETDPGSNGEPKPRMRLMLNPDENHEPETYEDLELDFCPKIFSSLERHLPPEMLAAPRKVKAKYMRNILRDFLPSKDRRYKIYREKIIANYQPLHQELYTINPEAFFVPKFLKAINGNTEKSFRSIMSQPIPGVFTFEMLQPHFCELLLSEVENFEKWVHETKFQIMRPNTMNKYGAALDDFGFQTMLNNLMEGFICPLSTVFFPEIGGSTLDSHHGFIVQYGIDRDVDMGLHVDDSEVTLNVCLGKNFSGGELFFRGMRCDKHLTTETCSEEIYDYPHVPGQAVLHHGRIRHGARATTAGQRANLLLWCRSAVFREMKKYKKDFCSWCKVCNQEKKDLLRSWLDTSTSALSRMGGETTA